MTSDYVSPVQVPYPTNADISMAIPVIDCFPSTWSMQFPTVVADKLLIGLNFALSLSASHIRVTSIC